MIPKPLIKTISILFACSAIFFNGFAHNGSVAFAYPLGKITVDGDFSDWPADATKHLIALHLSDTRPVNEADFSGFSNWATASTTVPYTLHLP